MLIQAWFRLTGPHGSLQDTPSATVETLRALPSGLVANAMTQRPHARLCASRHRRRASEGTNDRRVSGRRSHGAHLTPQSCQSCQSILEPRRGWLAGWLGLSLCRLSRRGNPCYVTPAASGSCACFSSREQNGCQCMCKACCVWPMQGCAAPLTTVVLETRGRRGREQGQRHEARVSVPCRRHAARRAARLLTTYTRLLIDRLAPRPIQTADRNGTSARAGGDRKSWGRYRTAAASPGTAHCRTPLSAL